MRESTETVDTILRFWFGDGKTAGEIAAEKTALWWGKDDSADREITVRFQTVTADVAARRLDRWTDSPGGMLALILCTDQFPRNIYRDTAAAFAHDPLAREFANACVDDGIAQRLSPIQQVFAYLPFEHSETLADQQRSVALYKSLAETAAAELDAELFATYLNFAQQHHDIIQRFNRFPHRNRQLGRKSTAEELEFLEQPGSSF